MRKLVAPAALVAVALLPAAAAAHPRAKVYRGTFAAVGADGTYTADKFGKAQLVDGKRNDKLSVHVRKLASRATYVFRLQAAPAGQPACEQGAPGGTDVPGWRYRRGGLLRTSRSGVANSWARSRTFTAASDVNYFVGVFTATAAGKPDQLVLCAALTRKRAHGKAKKHGPKEHGQKKHGPTEHGQKDHGQKDNPPGHDPDRGGGHPKPRFSRLLA